jgi:microcystin-dependent protein
MISSNLSKSIGGADVVASTHVVGSADLGGSWTLDASTLSTAALPAVPFTEQALANFEGGLGPVLVTTATPSVVFTAGGSAVALDPALTVSDSSSTTLASATVSIASGFRSGDTLNFTNQNGITGSYDATHGVLTLSGTSSLAHYQTALDSITYSYNNGNSDPTGGGSDASRTIDWIVDDGTSNSAIATTVTLHQQNDQPSLGLNQLVVESGIVPSTGDYRTDSGGIPVGSIRTFAGDFGQNPWGGADLADGQVLQISPHEDLNSVINQIYGGDGRTTLKLPDLQARLAVAYDNGPNFLGHDYGSDSVTLTTQNLPAQSGGSDSTFNNDQPSLLIEYMINTGGTFPGANSTYVLGEVVPFLSPVLVPGYLLANGRLLSIAQNTALFAVLGTTYGGDGVTTFALPNLTGSTIIGAGTDGSTTIALGTAVGQDDTNLTTANLPAPQGSGQAISNYQPSLALTYLIATQGLFPTSSGSPAPDQPYLGEIIAFAGAGAALGNMLSHGWAVADGELLQINSNTALFNFIGTTYGGNGTSTFALPDLIGRAIAGVGTNSDGTTIPLGAEYGSASITLTPGETPFPLPATSPLYLVHVAPTVTAGAAVTFAIGGTAVPLDSTLTVSDPDSGGNLTGAAVRIGTGFISGDTLNFTNTSHIVGSYNAGSGLLTLSGTDTLAGYQAALESITFATVAATGNRSIGWTVTDGSSSNGTSATAASTVDVAFVPQLDVGTPSPTFNGGGPAVTLDSRVQISDLGSTTLVGATVTISGGGVAGDILSFNNGSNTENFGDGGTIAYTGRGGSVLALTGTASLHDYQTALQQVQFSFNPANGDPTGGAANSTGRTISWVLNDGAQSSAAATTTLAIVHVAPTVTAGGTATFTGGGNAVALDGALAVSDIDSGGNLAGATISILAPIAGDTLNFTAQNGISEVSYTGGVLTLSGAATLAQYETALESVTYSFTGNGDPAAGGAHTSRSIDWVVTDGSMSSGSSATASSTLDLVHGAPTVTAGARAAFAIGGRLVPLDRTLTVSDADSGGILTGATVQIGTGFAAGDTLSFTNTAHITGNYDSSSGLLTLIGNDSVANYQTALDLITFSTSVGIAGTRAIDWNVADGSPSHGTSATTTSELDVVDASTPIITSVTATTVGNATDLGAGKVVTITVNFSTSVNVTGTPGLQLNDGETAGYAAGSGSSALVFTYTVQSNDNTPDLQVQGLLLGGGTIQDGAGHNANLANAAADLHLQVDTTAPTVVVSANSTMLLAGQSAAVTFTFFGVGFRARRHQRHRRHAGQSGSCRRQRVQSGHLYRDLHAQRSHQYRGRLGAGQCIRLQ